MKKSEMISRAYDIMFAEDNIEILITRLIEEALIMPPCNKHGNYDWDKEDANADATDTRSS